MQLLIVCRFMKDETMKFKQNFDALREDAANLIARIESLSSQAGDEAGERLHEGRERLRHGAEQAGQWVRHRACAVSKRVEERPHQAAVGALIIGVLLGAMLKRSTRD